MGSVVTYWSGRCSNEQPQSELLEYLERLAQTNDDRWQSLADRQKSFEKTESRSFDVDSKRSNFIRLEQSVAGRVLIGSSMLLVDQLPESLQHNCMPIESPSAWPSGFPAASLSVASQSREQRYAIQVPAFELRGISFRLYDPRCLYPGEDWMSFFFVDAPEVTELHGQIVHAVSCHTTRELDGEFFQNADWVIDTPSLHLRYYLEDWFDLLMVWIKVFFISDLEYWRNTILHRYDELKSSIDRLIESDGYEVAKEAVFEYLLESFESEADQLEAEIDRHS